MLERYTSIYDLGKPLKGGFYLDTYTKEILLWVKEDFCIDLENLKYYYRSLNEFPHIVRIDSVIYNYEGKIYLTDDYDKAYIKLDENLYYDYTDSKIVTDIIVTDVVDGFGVINNDDFGEFENV